jgi:hypothetical protein
MILDLVGNFMTEAAKSHVKVSSTVDTWSWTLKAPHGGKMSLYCKDIFHTTTAAEHNHITAAIPDGACVLAITARVTSLVTLDHDRTGVTIRTASGTGTVWGTLTADGSHLIAVGTTCSPTTAAAVSPEQVYADTDIVVMMNGGTTGTGITAGGVINIQAWYFLATAPTS